jgi:AcrR family transcriptional regulator
MLTGVPDRPYHHGNLRAVLLAEAERTLREQGIEALSLRDLARQAGVSHAAPRRHFADRQALLNALAETGFTRMEEEMRAAIDGAGEDYQARLRAVAAGYVRFAIRDPALAELMFAAKNAEPSAAVREASERLFTAFGDLIGQGQQAGALPTGDPELKSELGATVMAGLPADGDLREQAWHVWCRWIDWGTSDPRKKRALAQLSASHDITPASHASADMAMAGAAVLLDKVRVGGALRDAPVAFVVHIAEALADTTIAFMTQDPQGADKHRAAGFAAMWRAMT